MSKDTYEYLLAFAEEQIQLKGLASTACDLPQSGAILE